MTGHLSYFAANEQVADRQRAAGKHRAASKYRAARVAEPARDSQREAAAQVPRVWGRLRRGFAA
jgi:hypothetical protein